MSEIDNLKLNFTANSGGVSKSISDLKNSLSKLKSATSGGVGLSKISSELNGLANATNRLSNYGVQNITNLVNALQSLKNLKDIKISSSINNQINKLAESAQKLSGVNLNPIVKLGEVLKSLDMSGIKVTTTPVKLVEGIVKVVKELEQANLSTLAPKVREFTEALRSTENFKATGMSALLNAMNRLPNIEKSLRNINLDAFSQDIKELSRALAPLAGEFVKIGNVLDRMPTKFKATNQAMQKTIAASNGANTNGFISSAGSFITPLNAIQTAFAKAYTYANRAITPLSKLVGLTNQYVEDMNLFSVSLGKYAEEAYDYAQQVSDILGIDPGQFMRNQGLFMTLADGFGVASDRAFVMSQNLTQLGYDLSSFFNISVSDAMAKLQSGLAGELEPLRRIGYDLSKARLEAEALALGITKTYNEMTQAEKAQLRYHVIMTQVTQAQGDMARTLTAPANQLRVLQAQLIMAGRAIGSIFIPMLNAILPFAIAAVKVIRMLAEAIARLFGAKLPDVDFDSAQSKMPQIETPEIDKASDASEKLSDNLKDNKKKAEELKATILSFDQLHILNPQNKDSLDELAKKLPGGSGIEGLDDVGSWSDFDLPTYDFLEGALDSNIDKIISSWRKKLKPFWDWIKNNLDIIKNLIISIGAGFLTWKLSKAFMGAGGLGGLIETLKNWFKMNKIPIGLTLMVSGFTLASLGAYSIGYDGLNWKNLLQNIIGNALGVMGTLLVFGTGPLGWTVAIGLTIAINLFSFILGRNARIRDDEMKKRFGNLNLTDEQLGEWAKNITATLSVKNVRLMFNAQEKAYELEGQIREVIKDINLADEKISIGLDFSLDEYQSNIKRFIEVGQQYFDETYIVGKIGFEIMGDKGLGADWTQLYNETTLEFQRLGKEWLDATSKAFNDGKWDIDALKKAQEIKEEMVQIQQHMRKFEFTAGLETIALNFEVDKLTGESFMELQEELEKEQEKAIQDLNEGLTGTKASILMLYEYKIQEDPGNEKALIEERDRKIKEAEDAFKQKRLEVVLQVMSVQLNTLQEKFKSEIDRVEPIMKRDVSEMYAEMFPNRAPEEAYRNTAELFLTFQNTIQNGARVLEIPQGVRDLAKEMLESLTPQHKEWEELANDYASKGQKIPQELLDGLMGIEKLSLIAGAPNEYTWLFLEGIKNDPNSEKIIDELSTRSDAWGKEMYLSYLATTEEGQPKVNNATNELFKEVTNALENGTPEAKEAMVNAAETLYNGFDSGIGNNFTYSKVGAALGGIWSNITSWWRQNTGTLGVNVGTRTIIGGGTRSSSIQMMATGGFPDKGQMFIAREAGAEMVGSIGGRTAVANNSQIVDAVSAGVAQAVSAVMGTGQGGDLVVQIKNPNEVTAREIYRQNLSTARREGRVRV